MKRPNLLSITCLVVGLGFVLASIGCETIDHNRHEPFAIQNKEAVLAVVVDLSGSFADRFHENGDGYRFLLSISDAFFRRYAGDENRFVIAQLSGNDRSLIFEGGPDDFRRKFRNADEFRAFMDERADPNASRVHEAFADTLDHIAAVPGVEAGADVWVVVISDMIDSFNDPSASVKLDRSLQVFASYPRTAIGMYYVDQLLISEWRKRLDDAGFAGRYHLSPDFVGRPSPPNFE